MCKSIRPRKLWDTKTSSCRSSVVVQCKVSLFIVWKILLFLLFAKGLAAEQKRNFPKNKLPKELSPRMAELPTKKSGSSVCPPAQARHAVKALTFFVQKVAVVLLQIKQKRFSNTFILCNKMSTFCAVAPCFSHKCALTWQPFFTCLARCNQEP